MSKRITFKDDSEDESCFYSESESDDSPQQKKKQSRKIDYYGSHRKNTYIESESDSAPQKKKTKFNEEEKQILVECIEHIAQKMIIVETRK